MLLLFAGMPLLAPKVSRLPADAVLLSAFSLGVGFADEPEALVTGPLLDGRDALGLLPAGGPAVVVPRLLLPVDPVLLSARKPEPGAAWPVPAAAAAVVAAGGTPAAAFGWVGGCLLAAFAPDDKPGVHLTATCWLLRGLMVPLVGVTLNTWLDRDHS